MAIIPENPVWQTVTQIENEDFVLARASSSEYGISNKVLQELVNRTAYTKKAIEEFQSITVWDELKLYIVGNAVAYTPSGASSPHLYYCKVATTVAGFPPSEDFIHWQDLTPSAGEAKAPYGMIQQMPFTEDELPLDWIPLDGSKYATGSLIYNRLLLLPVTYKNRFNFIDEPDGIIIPNHTVTDDGDGVFYRSVATSKVGQFQGDAIRNIKGETESIIGTYYLQDGGTESLVVKKGTSTSAYGGQGSILVFDVNINFDASLSVPTAEDNRPSNIGLLPCLFLGLEGTTKITYADILAGRV